VLGPAFTKATVPSSTMLPLYDVLFAPFTVERDRGGATVVDAPVAGERGKLLIMTGQIEHGIIRREIGGDRQSIVRVGGAHGPAADRGSGHHNCWPRRGPTVPPPEYKTPLVLLVPLAIAPLTVSVEPVCAAILPTALSEMPVVSVAISIRAGGVGPQRAAVHDERLVDGHTGEAGRNCRRSKCPSG